MGITLMQDSPTPFIFFSGTVHIPEYNPSISTKHIECSGRKQSLSHQANGICLRFQTARNNFARRHRGYNGGAMDKKAIDQLDLLVT